MISNIPNLLPISRTSINSISGIEKNDTSLLQICWLPLPSSIDISVHNLLLLTHFVLYSNSNGQLITKETAPLPRLELAKLWVLGKRPEIPEFQNACMNNQMIHFVTASKFVVFAILAYNLATLSNPLTRLAITTMLAVVSQSFYEHVRANLPSKILLDILWEFKEMETQAKIYPPDLTFQLS